MRTLLIAIALLSGTMSFAGETFSFDWKQGNNDVGDLIVSVSESDDNTAIKYESTIAVNLGVDMEIEDQWTVIFDQNHHLTNVDLKSIMNGTTRVSILETPSQSGYVRTINGRTKPSDRSETDFSYVLLFIEAPKGLTALYSELYGVQFNVREAGKNSYIVTDSKNRKHRFDYGDDGLLKKASIELSIGLFDLVPQQNID